MKILHTADIHFGTNTHGRLDAKTGRNTRQLDFRNSFDFMVKRGLAENIDVFLFCGDAFRTASPSPTLQLEFVDCLMPVIDAGIPTVMITGNHDHPITRGLESSLEIFSRLGDHVYVFRSPTSTVIPTRKGDLQLLALPWPVQSVLLLGPEYQKAKPEVIHERLEQIYATFIQDQTATLDPALPTILAGHFSMHSEVPRDVREPVFRPSQLAVKPIDYVALGHIHKQVDVARRARGGPDPDAIPIVYSGTLEHIDFNEKGRKTGFVLVEIKGNPKKTTYEFVHTPSRPFLEFDLNVTGEDDPTQFILKEIARKHIDSCIVKVKLRVREAQWPHIDMQRIRAALDEAFCVASITRTSDDHGHLRETVIDRDLSLKEALGRYIDRRDHLAPIKQSLMEKAAALEAEAQA